MATEPIKWEEPGPEVERPKEIRKGKYDDLLNALKDEEPGRWALLSPSSHASLATNLQKKWPDFEFVARATDERWKSRIYARYMGIQ